VAAVAVVAALCAWSGASLIVLGDGSRGVAAGVGLATLGLALVAWQSSGPVAAFAILAGGGVVALLHASSGDGTWGIMPAGSTPRLILCVAFGLLAWWFAASVSLGPGVSHRFAVVVVLGLTAARILTSQKPSVVIAAAAVLALAVGEGADLGAHSVWPYLVASVIACVVALVPPPRPNVT
jgi:hypothetical protein